jgi:small subunit ribosomal protein S16
MLVIRMQRVGRSGHSQFRVLVQDSRQSPKSGKFVALLGSYDPHTKTAQLDKAGAEQFIKNGAHPSERVALLLKKEGIKLPAWVVLNTKKSGSLKNPDKLRKNRPAGSIEPKPLAESEPAAKDDTSKAATADSDTQATEASDEAAATAEETPVSESVAEKDSSSQPKQDDPEPSKLEEDNELPPEEKASEPETEPKV